ncbi:unnamed protein product [Sphagnum balticum]
MHARILSLLPSTSLVHGLAISKLSLAPAAVTDVWRTYRTLRPATTKFTRDLKELYKPISLGMSLLVLVFFERAYIQFSDDERSFLRIEPPSGLDTPVIYRNLLVEYVVPGNFVNENRFFFAIFSRFIRTWMRRGELALYQQLFNDTMYEVKRRQYSRWRKAMAKGAHEAVNNYHGIGLFLNPLYEKLT